MSLSSLIERLSTLTAGQPIYADDITAERDQLVNLLSGVSTNKRVVIVLSSATKAPLTTNQTGAGDLYKAQKDGSDSLRVLNNGQIKSTVLDGTPPIVAASTTKCTNLNADRVGGIEATSLVRNDVTDQEIKGSIILTPETTGTYSLKIKVDDESVLFYRYDLDKETEDLLFQINDLDQDTRVFTIPSSTRLLVGYSPTSDNDVARKKDLVDRNKVLIITDVFNSTPRGCSFVAPDKCVLTSLKVGFVSGTPSGDCTLTVYKNGVTTSQSVVLPSSASPNTSYSVDLTPIELVENDKVYVNATSLTGHNDIFATITGYWGEL